MKPFNRTDRIQTLRPRVLEIDTGLFRGYVDIRERQAGVPASSKSEYCTNTAASRDLAERQALGLAKQIRMASQRVGIRSQLLCDSLSDNHAGRHELDSIPAFLIRRPVNAPSTRKHLRAVA
ncbi:hypothetical protein [Bordetella muralis]|jgi:hypothetical protein|uniref:hypothetical protein n=1 Tax=Bordetella muralis TaxID=1649130 RepID=UPI0039EE8EDF